MIGPRHLTPAQRALVEAYHRHGVRDGSSSPCVWAALRAELAALPSAGPDPVEAEVQLMFQPWDVQAFDSRGGHVRMINGRRVARGRAVRRVNRRKHANGCG